MIVLLTTATHRRTHAAVARETGVAFRAMSYERAFHAFRLPAATYIFSDVDRLNFWDLELAARLYRRLEASGLRVLNDPARVRQRFRLLHCLFESGINTFDVWRVEETPRPPRFPVFLRTESAHRGALTGLLHTPEDVDTQMAAALASGLPERELMLVEYRARPMRNGVFRKLGMLRIGARLVPTLSAHQREWHAKFGELGVAGQQAYDDEYRLLTENPYEESIRRAFEVGRIEYGRADYGEVDGRPEVYEINTNPCIRPLKTHPFAIRLEASRLFFRNLGEALAEIDTPRGRPSVALADTRSWRQWLADIRAGRSLRRVPRMP